MANHFRRRSVKQDILEVRHSDFDTFIAGASEYTHAMSRPWEKFELTQSHDVETWVQDPSLIKSIQPNLQHLADVLQANASPPRAFSLLDVGCYAGYAFDYLSRRYPGADFSYTGVDVQPAAVQGAAALHAAKANAKFRLADVFNLDAAFPRAAFDFVFCARVLIHLPFFARAVAQLVRTARVAAVLAVKLDEQPWCKRILETDLDSGTQSTYFFRAMTPYDVRKAAESAGAKHTLISDSTYATVVLTPPARTGLLAA
jgi:trans-aconitate methyltransferase